jgi:hypothetical protein
VGLRIRGAHGAEVHGARFESRALTIFDRVAFLAWVMDDEGLAFRIARMFLANMPLPAYLVPYSNQNGFSVR